jgi:hypothetical protein
MQSVGPACRNRTYNKGVEIPSYIHLTNTGLERGRGIEPLTLVWKTKVIPFYEPRIKTLVPAE